jgi:hypothetical protein
VETWKVTPEGKVKNEVKKVLKRFNAHFDMPVNVGYGKKGVDFHCTVKSAYGALAFYIETKAPGETPTALQSTFLRERRDAQGAATFVIDGERGLARLEKWLVAVENNDMRAAMLVLGL